MIDRQQQAELLEQIAQTLREGRDPSLEFEQKHRDSDTWRLPWSFGNLLYNIHAPCREVRCRPRTVIIHAEIPEPVRAAPGRNTIYYVPHTGDKYGNGALVTAYTWKDEPVDYEFLSFGLVHLTKDNAESHARAACPYFDEAD